MPHPRIVISYAREDGKAIAAELRGRLEREDFSLWHDIMDVEPGEDWWRDITFAIEHAEYLILVMTPAALKSKYVRDEWRYARQEGTCVIPIKSAAELDFDVLPGWMRRVDFVNYEDPDSWRRFVRNLESPCEQTRVPFMVEDLPENFVRRPNEFDALIAELLDERREEPVAITAALRGAGGYGKTTLARALCHDELVQDAFHDGILWVTLGEEPGDLGGRVSGMIHTLTGERQAFDTLETAINRLTELLVDRRILMVIDDVWNAAHLRPFIQGGPNCARLITTRDADTLPSDSREIQVDAMQAEEAVELLFKEPPADQADALTSLADRLGEWPLLLKLAASMLRTRQGLGASLGDAVTYVNKALDRKGLTAFDARDPKERDQAVAVTLGVSLDHLDAEERARFVELAVFPEDVDVPLATLEVLWGLDDFDTEDLCQRLFQRSLLWSLDLTRRRIRLHDVVRAYLRDQTADLAALDAKLVAAYGERSPDGWHAGPDDGYFLQYLPWHLHGADRADELQALLFDYRWLRRKLEVVGVNPVIDDLERFGGSGEAGTLAATIRLSAHVLGQTPEQLAGQLWGRLEADDGPGIERLLADAREQAERPALLPCRPTLPGHGTGLIRTLAGHGGPVRAVAVTADGTRAVSGSSDNTLKVWDLATGAVEKTLEGHGREVSAVAVTADGRRAVSGSLDTTLKVWDLATGAVEKTLEGHGSGVTAVAVTADGRRAVSGSNDNTLKVWDLATGAVETTLEGHGSLVTAVAVTADGRRAASGSDDNTLKVWDLAKGAVETTLEGHGGEVNAVAVTADGRRAVSGSWDTTLKVWDLATGAVETTLEGHGRAVNAVAVTADGRRAVSGSNDYTLKVWNLATGAVEKTLEGHGGRVTAVAVTADGRRAVSGSDDNTLKVWDLATGAVEKTLEGHGRAMTAVAVTADGRRAVSSSWENTLKVWDLATGAVEKTFEGHGDWVKAVAVTADGRRAVSGSDDNALKVWDLATGAVEKTLEGHGSGVTAVAVTADGRRAVSASNDNTLKVWDLATGAVEKTLEGHGDWVDAVAVTADGRRAVSGSDDNTLRVWDLATGAVEKTLEGHGDWVDVAVTADGRRAVSGSDDNTLKVWDVASDEEVARFYGDASFHCCAVTPDGRFVVAGDAAGRVHVLEILE